MLIDSHTHTYFAPWQNLQDDIISRMANNGVSRAVQIGCDLASSQEALALAHSYPNTFWATVGQHPTEGITADMNTEKTIAQLDELISSQPINLVAIGEIGLDAFCIADESNKGALFEKQKEVFEAMLQLANKHNLPVVLHCRQAFEETMEILKRNEPKANFVMHCFDFDIVRARELFELFPQCFVGFAGMLTYKKSDALREVASQVDLSHILIETDAPFLSPQVVRKCTNEPAYVSHTFDFLCTLRTEKKSEIESTLWQNTCRFYRIPV